MNQIRANFKDNFFNSNSLHMNYICFSKNQTSQKQTVAPYHVLDSQNQESANQFNKHKQQFVLNSEQICKSQKRNAKKFYSAQKSQISNAPYINITQIKQKQKIKAIKKTVYQFDKSKVCTLQVSTQEKLLQKAIQISQKECELIQNLINQLFQEEKKIDERLEEVEKKNRMLKRMTPQIYQMEKQLQTSMKLKFKRYFNKKNENKYSGEVKIEQSQNKLKQTISLKDYIKKDISKNQIETKPNSPRSNSKNFNLIRCGYSKIDNSTIRKKKEQTKIKKDKINFKNLKNNKIKNKK